MRQSQTVYEDIAYWPRAYRHVRNVLQNVRALWNDSVWLEVQKQYITTNNSDASFDWSPSVQQFAWHGHKLKN